jgi:hypothetical protein
MEKRQKMAEFVGNLLRNKTGLLASEMPILVMLTSMMHKYKSGAFGEFSVLRSTS